MSPCEFSQKWNHMKNGKLVTFSSSDFDGLLVPGEAKKFLTEAGLPASAPPYLEFRKSQKLFFNKNNNFSTGYHYFPIGTTGAGDFVCIKTNGNIINLVNGNQKQEVFINSTINQFAECLLLFSGMIDKAIEMNGEDAYLDNQIPPELFIWIRNEIKRIDPIALEEGEFWDVEIQELKNG